MPSASATAPLDTISATSGRTLPASLPVAERERTRIWEAGKVRFQRRTEAGVVMDQRIFKGMGLTSKLHA